MAQSIKKTAKAFSLIELLVVVAIFATISSVVLANHSRFNNSVLLGSLAYDIALSMRQAQVYGLSVKQFSNQFQVGYGIRFEGTSSYIFFADVNANKRYDSGTDSIVETFTLGRGHRVLRFCATPSSGLEKCTDSSNPITSLDVVFFRPNPDAWIRTSSDTVFSRARIVVASVSNETRTINIQSTGQISITQP